MDFFGQIKEKINKKINPENIILIDNSSFFRMDPDVPLIVPQVNPEVAKNLKKIFITIFLLAALIYVVKFLTGFF